MRRPVPAGAAASRAATDALLSGLRAGRWRPNAWAWFLAAATRRSLAQAVAHPRAAAEVTVLHLAVHAAGGRPAGRWTAGCWALAVTHLGLLGERRSIGVANAVTLLRANLPVLAAGRWLGAVAVASDLLDGCIARRCHSETAFGYHADSLADAAFWTWYGLHGESSRAVRLAVIAAWAVPVAAVTAASIARGGMIDPPRPAVLRPAAALQLALAARALLRAAGRAG
jgi:phosphatidylglycerophosphate synthase